MHGVQPGCSASRAVSRNTSYTSLLPSVPKLGQFAQHTDARCRHYCWATATPVWVAFLIWVFHGCVSTESWQYVCESNQCGAIIHSIYVLCLYTLIVSGESEICAVDLPGYLNAFEPRLSGIRWDAVPRVSAAPRGCCSITTVIFINCSHMIKHMLVWCNSASCLSFFCQAVE